MRLFCDPSRLSHADGSRKEKPQGKYKKGTRPLKEQEAVISLYAPVQLETVVDDRAWIPLSPNYYFFFFIYKKNMNVSHPGNVFKRGLSSVYLLGSDLEMRQPDIFFFQSHIPKQVSWTNLIFMNRDRSLTNQSSELGVHPLLLFILLQGREDPGMGARKKKNVGSNLSSIWAKFKHTTSVRAPGAPRRQPDPQGRKKEETQTLLWAVVIWHLTSIF